MFSREQLERYSRQFVLREIGVAGQKRLLDARVLVIGAGALGSPALLYLAAAGVGCLGVADFDTVDRSNLQRQIIHNASRLGRSKALS
ncbi:MAG: ThiF family adenylyltransferase, partial [Firmicutes bacterium]|nr:ThiF family adenylyltransferase [Bacillota bacterium]